MSTNSILLRLRAANPVPRPSTTQDPELFARITALPSEGRSRRSATQRRGLAIVVALALMALLASTAFAISNWMGEAVKPRVTKQEYLRARHQLTLPPGAAWPDYQLAPPNSVTGRGAGGGHAVLASKNAWECYWVRAIERGDVAGQRRAHAELNALFAHNIVVAPDGASENWTPPNPRKTPYAVFVNDGGVEWFRASYAAAAAGHAQNLISSCRANAPG